MDDELADSSGSEQHYSDLDEYEQPRSEVDYSGMDDKDDSIIESETHDNADIESGHNASDAHDGFGTGTITAEGADFEVATAAEDELGIVEGAVLNVAAVEAASVSKGVPEKDSDADDDEEQLR